MDPLYHYMKISTPSFFLYKSTT